MPYRVTRVVPWMSLGEKSPAPSSILCCVRSWQDVEIVTNLLDERVLPHLVGKPVTMPQPVRCGVDRLQPNLQLAAVQPPKATTLIAMTSPRIH